MASTDQLPRSTRPLYVASAATRSPIPRIRQAAGDTPVGALLRPLQPAHIRAQDRRRFTLVDLQIADIAQRRLKIRVSEILLNRNGRHASIMQQPRISAA